ncbi:MAG: SagB/ThcOx family dehydrogenase [Opitutaceae bacterium]|nr:SagB/ThcOx family dehydrogenase [Opitutaceae bacterium]
MKILSKAFAKTFAKILVLPAALCAFATATVPLSAQDIALPAPQKTGGIPVMDALAKRATGRSFDPARELTPQQLSNLLWSAWGINRADGRRTAPSANNKQETDLYVLLKTGAYRYDAKAGALVLVAAGDKRESGGVQPFVKDAPVTLVIVADLSKLSQKTEAEKREVAAVNAGYISQNIYLHCASEGLATGARMMLDRAKLATALSLKPTQWAVIANSVGYAKK